MQARFKFAALFSLLTLGSILSANATLVVNAPEPAPQYDINSTQFDLYIAGGANPTPSPGYINTTKGFRYIQTDSGTVGIDSNYVWVDVFSDKQYSISGTQRVIVMLTIGAPSSGTEIKIRGAGVKSGTDAPSDCSADSNCQNIFTDNAFYSAIYARPGDAAGKTLRIKFRLDELCAGGGSASQSLCGSGAAYGGINHTMLTAQMSAVFWIAGDNTAAKIPYPLDSNSETRAFNLFISDIAPSSSCNNNGISESDFYFPGDSEIFLKTNNIAVGNAPSAATTPGPPATQLVFLGKIGGVATPAAPPGGLTPAGSDVISYVNANAGDVEVSGADTGTSFVNAESNGDTAHSYTARVHAQNFAGMLSDVDDSCSPNTFTVRTQPINGILTESKCFIATAAYHDGRAGPVMMLRQFRDKVLSKFAWGQAFIDKYYEVSPALAQWAWDKPMIRSLALKLLTPLEFAAWVSLKVADAQTATPPVSSGESYIDRLKKTLPVSKSEPTGSYSEEQKKVLDQKNPTPPASSDGYSAGEQQKLKNSPEEAGKSPEDYKNYSEKEKASVPPSRYRNSPTELVKQGKDRKLGRGDVPPIKNAISFRMGVSPGMKVSVAGGLNTFEDIYGAGWQPEILFHFERQLFHSEDFGSFGVSGELGLSYAEGFGRLTFPFAGTKISQTKFSFVQAPLLVGGDYRFNFFRILRPYAGAGLGTMLYTEIRKDKQKDKRGYSFIYDAHVGISLLMDFLDEGTARDSYLSQGIQHTYFFAEYFYLNTFSGRVTFNRSGVYSGFLFEL